MKIDKTLGAITVIIFIVYNVCVFLIGGFAGHNVVFWTSYIMELISMLSVFAMTFRVTIIGQGKKLLFLGYSVFVWSAIFFIIQFVVTTISMIVDRGLKFTLTVEVLLLAIYIIFILVSFKNQEIIQKIQEERTVSIEMMKTLTLQLGTVAEICMDKELKTTIYKLKEAFEYSDVVSSVKTEDIENQMFEKVGLLKNVCRVNAEQAKELCKELEIQLKERNLICQNTKKRF